MIETASDTERSTLGVAQAFSRFWRSGKRAMTHPGSYNEAKMFLRTCLEPEDWTALLLKNRYASKAVQQIGSLPWALQRPGSGVVASTQ